MGVVEVIVGGCDWVCVSGGWLSGGGWLWVGVRVWVCGGGCVGGWVYDHKSRSEPPLLHFSFSGMSH